MGSAGRSTQHNQNLFRMRRTCSEDTLAATARLPEVWSVFGARSQRRFEHQKAWGEPCLKTKLYTGYREGVM